MTQRGITVFALPYMAAILLMTASSLPVMAETKPATPPATSNAKQAMPATKPTPAKSDKAEFEATTTHTLDNYQVKLPAVFPAPAHELRDLKNDKGDMLGQLSLYKALYKYAAFLSSVSPSAKLSDPTKVPERLEAAKKSFLSRKINPQELASKTTTVQGYPALEFQVKAAISNDNPAMVYTRALDVMVAPDKFYQFVFLSDKQSDLTAPWVNRYFESISFTK
jgi:hypothetical protein